jgi:formate dehydrogenase (NADP+) beta subunit
MADKIKLTIDGESVEVQDGISVLEAAQTAGIYVPSLCFYQGIRPLPEESPDLACQLCLVEIDGKIVLSCDTQARSGMIVKTDSPQIKELRQRSLTDILRRHPSACLVCWRKEICKPYDICLRSVSIQERCVLCPANKQCELQKAVGCIGIKELPPTMDKQLPTREDSPFFVRDNNLCINCERCVRVCDKIRGARAIEFAYPCHVACPSGIDIPRYIRAVGRGRPGTALAVIREKVPFPGVLGRVCIHPCEQACQRGKIAEKPLQIRLIKRFAADQGDDSWKKMSKQLPPTGKKVAVIGSGPAGLTTALYLAKLGHKITVFESQFKPGGMMWMGIPEYRLPRAVLDGEIKDITDVGIELKTNSPVKSLDPLFTEGYNAIFLGLGAHQGMKLSIEGETLPGVMEAVDFLRRGNSGETINVGERVGVVGGGNVAIDAARLSRRFGAQKVTIFYRRTRAEMPAATEEVEAAIAEGVEILYLTSPARIIRENNTLKFYCSRMKLGEPDASGRPRPVPIENSEFITEMNTLLVAIGQRPDIPSDFKVEVGRGNVVKVDANLMSSRKGVFSGGDCVSGAASVIEAIAAGRKAAESIDCYLGGKGDITESLVVPEEAEVYLPEGTIQEKVAPVGHLPPEKSVTSFEEVEQPWDRDTAMAEAQRCLRCYVIAPPDQKVLKEANCQFCGACVDSCPTGALMERSAMFTGQAARTTTTTCPYCGVGCQLNIEVKDNTVSRVVPGNGPANRGQACVKGKFGLDFIHDPNRLKVPLIKRNGEFEEATWDEALDLIVRKMSGYKPEEVAVISSARCTNEDNYVIQKFTRTVLGTNNIDHCARL